VEQRVAALETQMQNVNGLVHATRRQMQTNAEDQNKAMDMERQKRSEEDADLRRLIDTGVAGGVALEITGLVWLFFGLVLANTSTELVKLPLFQ
jgi:hypothetical protein